MSNNENNQNANHPKKVIALFDYNGSDLQKNLLSFKKGDILEIIESNESNWWKAKDSSGKIALIPANYTKEFESSTSPRLIKKGKINNQ